MQDDRRIIRIEDKLDKVSDRLGSIDATLAKQHESLKEHIRRTDLLEKQVEPIKKHVAMLHGALKLVGVIGMLVALAEGILSVLNHV